MIYKHDAISALCLDSLILRPLFPPECQSRPQSAPAPGAPIAGQHHPSLSVVASSLACCRRSTCRSDQRLLRLRHAAALCSASVGSGDAMTATGGRSCSMLDWVRSRRARTRLTHADNFGRGRRRRAPRVRAGSAPPKMSGSTPKFLGERQFSRDSTEAETALVHAQRSS